MWGVLQNRLILGAAAAAASFAAHAAELTIVNASETPFQHLFVSPCGAGQWGPDQLADALPPSRLVTVSNIAAGCYDVEIVVAPWNVCVIAGAALNRRQIWKLTRWDVFGSQSGDCSHVAGYVPTMRRPWVW
jgi:hypothetical protein